VIQFEIGLTSDDIGYVRFVLVENSDRRTRERFVASEATVVHGNRNLEATEIDLCAGMICVGTAGCVDHAYPPATSIAYPILFVNDF